MPNFKRRRPRTKVRCKLCTPNRDKKSKAEKKRLEVARRAAEMRGEF
jgi:hypothetical protein